MQTSYKKSQKILAHIKKKVYLCPRNKFISRAEIQKMLFGYIHIKKISVEY